MNILSLVFEIVLAIAAFSLSMNVKMVLSKLKEIELDLTDLKVRLAQLEIKLEYTKNKKYGADN
ncbi:MAG: hypothetical protein KatS3mg087_1894 [Patescibacteria group bacterium]|nr:MAG: hypothetical protein KatS3mg087_1894 [Patescibacteria group bacterium]